MHDGHDFVLAALKAGAALAVVATARRGELPHDAPLLVVDDVLDGLRSLARAARARLNAQVIAVTGSVGKTSTKEALRRVLGAQGETHTSTASFNNHWGVPLSLARCPATARFPVFEITVKSSIHKGDGCLRRKHLQNRDPIGRENVGGQVVFEVKDSVGSGLINQRQADNGTRAMLNNVGIR